MDLGGFEIGKRILNRREMTRWSIERPELLAPGKDPPAGEDVDAERGQDAEPGGRVDKGDAEDNPICIYPTPERCVAVDFTSRGRGDKDVGECNDERATIAHYMVLPFQRLEPFGLVVVENRQVDVDGHGKIPQGVCWQEPAHCQPDRHRSTDARRSPTFESGILGIGRDVSRLQLGLELVTSVWQYCTTYFPTTHRILDDSPVFGRRASR